MKLLFINELVKFNITILVSLKKYYKSLCEECSNTDYKNSSKYKSLKFQFKNYNKWFSYIDDYTELLNKEDNINNVLEEESIDTLSNFIKYFRSHKRDRKTMIEPKKINLVFLDIFSDKLKDKYLEIILKIINDDKLYKLLLDDKKEYKNKIFKELKSNISTALISNDVFDIITDIETILKEDEKLLLDDVTNLYSFKEIFKIIKQFYKFVNKDKSKDKFKNDSNNNNLNKIKINIDENNSNTMNNFNTNYNQDNSNNNSDNDSDNENMLKPKDEEIDILKLYNIESIPKKLGPRPKHNINKARDIWELQILHGVGEAKAKELSSKNLTLKLLLDEWSNYISKDKNNEILNAEIIYNNRHGGHENITEYDSKEIIQIEKEIHNKLEHQTNYLKYLNHEQLLGIKYFNDITKRIPRDEIDKTKEFLDIVTKSIHPKLKLKICGSYRRGNPDSGDIDILMALPDLKTPEELDEYNMVNKPILMVFVEKLSRLGFLNDHLTKHGATKYMGFNKLPSDKYTHYRRIDIMFMPYNTFGSSVLYFTGSWNFNIQMRNKALSMNMTLSQYGVFKTENGKKTEQMPTPTEKDVFKVLKMDYVKPTKRNI
jgi:hypothetical protein